MPVPPGLNNVFATPVGDVARIIFYETDAAVDEKMWDITANNSTLAIRSRTDVDSPGTTFLSLLRTGSGLSNFTMNAVALFSSGSASAPSISFTANPTTGWYNNAGNMELSVLTNNYFEFGTAGNIGLSAANPFIVMGAASDLQFGRDSAADVLALKRTSNAQTFRIYGTTTNNKFLSLAHDGTNSIISGSGGTINVALVAIFSNGSAAAPSIAFNGSSGLGFYDGGSQILGAASAGANAAAFVGVNFTVRSDGSLSFASGTDAVVNGADVKVVRDAADVLALKRASSAQTLRIYGTTTNNKYLNLTHDGTNGIITVSGGSFGFGTFVTSSGTPSSPSFDGYITIVDSGGVSRRLLVAA